MKRFFKFLTLGAFAIFSACSSADPDDGSKVDPDAKVDDPDGTIMLSMRNDDKTNSVGQQPRDSRHSR